MPLGVDIANNLLQNTKKQPRLFPPSSKSEPLTWININPSDHLMVFKGSQLLNFLEQTRKNLKTTILKELPKVLLISVSMLPNQLFKKNSLENHKVKLLKNPRPNLRPKLLLEMLEKAVIPWKNFQKVNSKVKYNKVMINGSFYSLLLGVVTAKP